LVLTVAFALAVTLAVMWLSKWLDENQITSSVSVSYKTVGCPLALGISATGSYSAKIKLPQCRESTRALLRLG
jgi:hypothetical protein